MNPFSDSERPVPPLSDRDHIRGASEATVVLMEYGDFQCPQSGQAYTTIRALQEKLGPRLCFVFRHFPQPQSYPQAQKAAESAEAAAAQGKFWEMHDTLFSNQPALEDGNLVEYAASIGLDMPRFLRELADHVHQERVQTDIDSAQNYGVSHTPTFFIGILHQGTQNLEVLLMKILEATAA
ncbi:MAG: thioredoxin domain-containing protein [Cyanothece sp. SIO1E1]|nr:thioredoxin domain-containing protein [Cyanothece sp. SIO1E1]